MEYRTRVKDPEVAVASGELVPAQHLPRILRVRLPSTDSSDSLESCPPPLPPKDKRYKTLPYNLFLIPKNGKPVSLPKAKQLSRWGRFQLWFNAYR